MRTENVNPPPQLRAPGEKVESGFSHYPARLLKNLDRRAMLLNRLMI